MISRKSIFIANYIYREINIYTVGVDFFAAKNENKYSNDSNGWSAT